MTFTNLDLVGVVGMHVTLYFKLHHFGHLWCTLHPRCCRVQLSDHEVIKTCKWSCEFDVIYYSKIQEILNKFKEPNEHIQIINYLLKCTVYII